MVDKVKVSNAVLTTVRIDGKVYTVSVSKKGIRIGHNVVINGTKWKFSRTVEWEHLVERFKEQIKDRNSK